MKTTYTIHPDGGRSVTQYAVPELIPRSTPARSNAHATARYCIDLVRLAVSFTLLIGVLSVCGAGLFWLADKLVPSMSGLSWLTVGVLTFIGLSLWVLADK